MIKRGIVVATHPEDHSVDVVLSDGRRLSGVQVMTPNGSARSGTFDMPAMPDRGASKWDITKEHGQDQIALVSNVDGIPVVVGYLFPQVSQMTFADARLRYQRHQSDVAWSIDGDGNIQLDHPSGTYVRIGESPDRVDHGGKNTDKSLAVDRNTGRRVNIRIGMAGGALELTLSPTGAVSLRCDQEVSIDAGDTVTVKAPAVVLETPHTVCTGDLTVQGTTAVQGITSRDVDISSTHAHANSGGPGVGGTPV